MGSFTKMLRFNSYYYFLSLLIPIPFHVFSEDIYEQDELVVTATLAPVPKNTIGSAITVITADEIEKRGNTFLSDILREVPGFAVNRSGTFGTLTQVRVRGAEANHTLVLIDGVEVNNPASSSEFNFGFLSSSNIERIEIIRGAQSALWGSDAIGAVINIITKKGQGPLSLKANFEGGSFATEHSELGMSYGNNFFNINLNADIIKTDGTNIARTGTEKDGFHGRTYDLKLGLNPFENFEVNIIARKVNSEIQTDASSNGFAVDGKGTDNTEIEQDFRKANVKISLLDDRWINQFNIESTKSNSIFNSSNFATSFSNGKKVKYSYQSNFNFDTSSYMNATHNFSILFDYEDDTARGSFVGGKTEVGFESKSYATEYQLGLNEQLFLTAGIRFDGNDFFDNATTYRFTGAFIIPETNSRLHLSYGTGVKNPTISELFGNFAAFKGNPNLKSESSKGWDVGVEQNLFEDKLNVDVTYFKNLITDQISGNNSTAVNSNGTNQIYGLELFSKLLLTDDFDINASYTYTRGDTATGIELTRRPMHIANLNMNHSFLRKKANLNLGVNYNGNQEDDVFVTGLSRVRLSSYVLVNLSGRYKLNKFVSFKGRIENLLDESYEEVFGFTSPGIGGYLGINFTLNP
jgi:vitamin B12 transporter